MKRVPIDRARPTLSDICDGAQRGEAVTITRHGKPVAEVVPAGTWDKASPTPNEPVGPSSGDTWTVTTDHGRPRWTPTEMPADPGAVVDAVNRPGAWSGTVPTPARLHCSEHGYIGDTTTIAPVTVLRGVASMWCCPVCRKGLVTWADGDWQARFAAAYPDRRNSASTCETTADPDGSLRVVTTTVIPPPPEDWTDADREALLALAVGNAARQ